MQFLLSVTETVRRGSYSTGRRMASRPTDRPIPAELGAVRLTAGER